MNSLTSTLTRGVLSKHFKYCSNSNMIRLDFLHYCSVLSTSKNLKVGTQSSRSLSKFQSYLEPFSSYFYFPRGGSVDRFKKLIYKVLFMYSSDKINNGLHTYNTVSKLNYVEFFNLLDMPDTFYSWYKVTELHVWMLLVRVSDLQDDGMIPKRYVMEGLWVDVEEKAKKVEPLNIDFKKNMTNLSNKFKIALLSYDEGFLTNDQTLANAVWYQFFDKKCDDPRKLEALVSYIRFQIKYLQSLNTNVLIKEYKEKIIWTPLKPHFQSKS